MTKSNTGPKTPEGKRAVSRNAIKHAIFSQNPVVIVGVETIEEWEHSQAQVSESWDPQGEYERQLAYDIAWNLWRLRRCRIHEAARLTTQVDEAVGNLYDDEDDDDDGEDDKDDDNGDENDSGSRRRARRPRRVRASVLRAAELLNVIPDGWSLDRILRYETHVRRALLQTIHELEVCQARRAGVRAPLARVDFTASPSLRRPTGPRSSSTFQQLDDALSRDLAGLAKRRRGRGTTEAWT